MNHTARLACVPFLLSILCLVALPGHRCLGQINQALPSTKATKPDVPSAEQSTAERKREERREFQSQELMLAKSGSWFFTPGETP